MANGTPRAGNNAWYTNVYSLALASTATAYDIWTLGVDRLSDRTVWLYGQLVAIRAALAQTSAGTQATVVGSVDLSGLTYDPIVGTLNGLTLQVTADTGGTITTTFGTGIGAPTGPAGVVAAIAAAAGGAQIIAEDAAGHLNLSSSTTGSGSTVTVTGGTAVSAVGLTNGQNATGVATGNDGISLVGGAQVVGSQGTIPAGTLRSMLAWVANRLPAGTLTRVETSLIMVFNSSPPYPQIPGDAATIAGNNLYQPLLSMPNGSSLTSVSWYLKPDAHGTLPVTMPNFRVQKINIITGVATTITAIITDPSANTTAYDQAHAIVAPITLGNGLGGTSDVIDRTQYAYYAFYQPEAGTNHDDNATIMGAVSTFTV